LARAGGSLTERLGELARTIGESLDYATVAITLYRPAWDDFRVTAVSGREQARSTLLGCTRTWEEYRPLLDDRFLRRGAYVIPAGSHDWSRSGTVYSPPVEPVPDDPDAWHPEDVLLVVLKASDGSLLGVMSVDEPASLRRPNDDDLDVLVTVAERLQSCEPAGMTYAPRRRKRSSRSGRYSSQVRVQPSRVLRACSRPLTAVTRKSSQAGR
jgi:hypothetical protein